MDKKTDLIFIEGRSVNLLAASREDALFTAALLNRPDIRKHLADRFPKTLENVEKMIFDANSRKELFLVIQSKEDGERAGVVTLHDFSWYNRRAEMTIALHPDYQGRGLGMESVQLVVRHAFDNMQIHKILLEVYASNDNAVKMYKSCGFVIEGHFKNHSFKDGRYNDLLVMSIINE